MKRLFLVLLAALPAAAFSGPADVPDLLDPLSQAEENEVSQNNRAWLSKNLESARRHRLVRVNSDVLLSSERFRIVLFDGRSMLLEVTEREVHGSAAEPYRFEWTGRVADPPLTAEDLLAINPDIGSFETAKFLHEALLAVSVRGTRYLRDVATGGSWPVPHDHFGDDCRCPRPEPVPGTVPFYTVRGDFEDLRLPFSYQLRPLERDPEYHVLIEIDPATYRESKVEM